MTLIKPTRVPIEIRISPVLYDAQTVLQRKARYWKMEPEKDQVTHALSLRIAVYIYYYATTGAGEMGRPFTLLPPRLKYLTGNNSWVIELATGKTPLDELGKPFGIRQHETQEEFEARAEADPRVMLLQGDALDLILFGRDTETPLDERLATAMIDGDDEMWNSYAEADPPAPEYNRAAKHLAP